MKQGRFNVIDLFSGCGGLSYGFAMAGYNILLGVDNDAVALKTFKLNHSGAFSYETDISKCSGADIQTVVGNNKIDVIIGGPPCQGFSLSGPRKFDDARNRLYLSFIRLVKELRPKAFLIENVPGLVGLFDGKIKEQILSRLSSLGYSTVCGKLNAAGYGVPQLRNRVFFVGLFGSAKSFEFPKPKLKSSEYISAEDAIGDLPSLKDEAGHDPSPYLPNQKLSEYQIFCRKNATHLHNHVVTNHDSKTKKIIAMVPEGGNYKNLPAEYRGSRNFHVAWTRLHSKKPAFTIDTGHRHHFHYCFDRVPTVRESARIQSFPDTFIFIGNKSQQYKQVGNAVSPLLAKAIADKLKRYL